MKINNENINHIGKDDKEESIKFLGVHIYKHITWKNHINIISSKISRAMFAIICLKKSVYYTLIQSHLSYGIQARENRNTVKTSCKLNKNALYE